jgi:hypothetical protein
VIDNITTPLKDASLHEAGERVFGAIARETDMVRAEGILVNALVLALGNDPLGEFITQYRAAQTDAVYGADDPDPADVYEWAEPLAQALQDSIDYAHCPLAGTGL